jgi:hypothetical protein
LTIRRARDKIKTLEATMKKLMCLVLSLGAGVANAGSLGEGLRGKRWGESVEAAPSPVCGRESDNSWICTEKVGDVEVDVSYGKLEDHQLYSVVMTHKGFAGCQTLLNTLSEAWGRGGKNEYDSSPLPKMTWFTLGAIGSFEYNRYSDRCTILAMSTSLYREKEREDKKKAAKAASSL